MRLAPERRPLAVHAHAQSQLDRVEEIPVSVRPQGPLHLRQQRHFQKVSRAIRRSRRHLAEAASHEREQMVPRQLRLGRPRLSRLRLQRIAIFELVRTP